MNEAKFTTEFLRWAKYNWTLGLSGPFEAKFTKGKSIPFKHLQEHQNNALKQAGSKFFGYKIPDVGNFPKPFDGVIYSGAPAWMVIQFYTRGCKTFYIIEISDWNRLESTCGRKSITEDLAKDNAYSIGTLK